MKVYVLTCTTEGRDADSGTRTFVVDVYADKYDAEAEAYRLNRMAKIPGTICFGDTHEVEEADLIQRKPGFRS